MRLYRTGWFLLLVIMLAGMGWLIVADRFTVLDQWNRTWLSISNSTHNSEMESSRFRRAYFSVSHYGISALNQMLRNNPNTQFFWMPQQPLSAALLAEIDSAYQGQLLIVNQDFATGAGYLIGEVKHPWYRMGIHPPTMEAPIWRVDAKIVMAPLVTRDSGMALLWMSSDRYWPSALSYVWANINHVQSAKLRQGLDLQLLAQDSSWSLGLKSIFYFSGETLESISIERLLQGEAANDLQIVVLAAADDPVANQFSIATNQLVKANYLQQGWYGWLLQWLLLIAGIILSFKLAERALLKQVLIWLAFLLSVVGVQYIAAAWQQWVPISVTMLSSLLVLLVANGYQSERRLFQAQVVQQNRLLGEAAKYFYQAREFEKVKPWLAQAKADRPLVEKIFDLALTAESEQNRTLAIKLFEWIENSGVAHSGAVQKLSEYRQVGQQPDESGLDATMVIAPGQTTTGSMLNPLLSIENFGRYRVEGVLGRGAMGIVFQGVDPKINRHVAIKTLQLVGDESEEGFAEIKQRFFREAETAGNLSHANIVTIYDVGEEGELGYIAMDLLTGAPLSKFLKPEHRLPTPLIYQLMIQITDALDYAHRQNVIHRDIKPANIIYDDDIQRVTLTDFGIACMADQSKTKTGTIIGSPFYMSPEQVLGQRVDGRSDVFSLGVTFYQLLCGHLPFNGESIASVAYHITKTKHESVRYWDSKLPSSAVRITNKALNKEPEKRFQTMLEFKQTLIAALKRDFKKAPII